MSGVEDLTNIFNVGSCQFTDGIISITEGAQNKCIREHKDKKFIYNRTNILNDQSLKDYELVIPSTRRSGDDFNKELIFTLPNNIDYVNSVYLLFQSKKDYDMLRKVMFVVGGTIIDSCDRTFIEISRLLKKEMYHQGNDRFMVPLNIMLFDYDHPFPKYMCEYHEIELHCKFDKSFGDINLLINYSNTKYGLYNNASLLNSTLDDILKFLKEYKIIPDIVPLMKQLMPKNGLETIIQQVQHTNINYEALVKKNNKVTLYFNHPAIAIIIAFDDFTPKLKNAFLHVLDDVSYGPYSADIMSGYYIKRLGLNIPEHKTVYLLPFVKLNPLIINDNNIMAEHQYLNFSRIDDVKMTLNTHVFTGNCNIYAITTNIGMAMSGMYGTKFSN
jgi:hypothetical protein